MTISAVALQRFGPCTDRGDKRWKGGLTTMNSVKIVDGALREKPAPREREFDLETPLRIGRGDL